ncbi:MAG TPA: hypothetical protein VF230_09385 [Acidimicrobiales bacterium]
MTVAAVRSVVLVVCAAGIAGMIVSSIAGSNGAAMTFGLVTAAAVLCSIVATAVTVPGSQATGAGGADVDELGAAIEDGVARLVAGGADERDVRDVVANAVRLGRVSR